MKVCLNCGKNLVGNKKYCDNKCQADYQHKEWVIRWKQGLESGLKGEYGISQHLKRYLFEKFNNKCCKCGWGRNESLFTNYSFRNRSYRWRLFQ